MRCPTLAELPPPPPGKTGWPWTEESEQLPDEMPVRSEAAEPDDRPRTTDDTSSSIVHRPSSRTWPRVSIVTPSYNQGQFIEETIRSVLLQGYPNLEYIIIDGGSTDGSVEIIRKYEPWLAYWVSEPDGGQSEALIKGFSQATGKIISWLNSDDFYQPGVFSQIATYLLEISNAGLIYGDCKTVTTSGENLIDYKLVPGELTLEEIVLHDKFIPQQSAFFRSDALKSVGGLNRDLHYVMDFDLWLRLANAYSIVYVPQTWGNIRIHTTSKSVADRYKFGVEGSALLEAQRGNLHVDDLIIDEGIRRRFLWAALELIRREDNAQAIPYLIRALTGTTHPYGSLVGCVNYTLGFLNFDSAWSPRSYASSLTVLTELIQEMAEQHSPVKVMRFGYVLLAQQAYWDDELAIAKYASRRALNLDRGIRTNRKAWELWTKASLGRGFISTWRHVKAHLKLATNKR